MYPIASRDHDDRDTVASRGRERLRKSQLVDHRPLHTRITSDRLRRGPVRAVGVVAFTAATVLMASAYANAEPPDAGPSCPDLYVFGVQGTSESSRTADPQSTTGMVGQIFGSITHDGTIGYQEIGYDAAFGGAPGTGPGQSTFTASASEAGQKLGDAATSFHAQCPATRIGFVAFSQGAGVVSDFARDVGAGRTSIPPDRVAGVAVLSDWTRPPGAEPIPGRPGQTSTDPVPGTEATASSQVQFRPVPSTAGIAPNIEDFGDLTGHVVEICIPGDLSCDAPPHAQLLRAAGGVVAQADLHDPIAAVGTLAATASAAVSNAATTAVLDDVQIDQGQVNYLPAETISARIADGADPRNGTPTPQQQQDAAARIAQVAAAVAADPLGQIPRLAGQIGAAIDDNLAANADLANPATLARYAGVVANHTGYANSGDTQRVATWLDALSHDIGQAAP
ncbi:Cutinase [Nocardia africana]|uniref:Cutinase n=1 Tax=Nocardia africana TaxID=134964 RepID=A0A378WHP9_9NOCA|nr:Cutinase [Nocardia africana]